MRILSAEFITSAAAPPGYPGGGLPEIAFCGRSNVGKSSLINCLLTRKRLAQTSKTPGKTRTINFFLINESFYFVDLPGYGYAKTGRSLQQSWGRMVETYLSSRSTLCAAVHLVDIRHPPTRLDVQMKEWLDHYRKRVVVAATKDDKLGAQAARRSLAVIAEKLPVLEGQPLIPFSSRTGRGKESLWKALTACLRGEAGGGGPP